MEKIKLEELKLVGLALPFKTCNRKKQSDFDCGNLWQQFEKEEIKDKIPGKKGNEIYAVYHHYEGDHTHPFSYFIGCRVNEIAEQLPTGLTQLIIPSTTFNKITAQGKMPDCVAAAWKEIWENSANRVFKIDFEVYNNRSKDWNNAEVDIYVSVA